MITIIWLAVTIGLLLICLFLSYRAAFRQSDSSLQEIKFNIQQIAAEVQQIEASVKSEITPNRAEAK